MFSKWTGKAGISLGLTLLLLSTFWVINGAIAQEAPGDSTEDVAGEVSVAAAVNSRISYQGVLEENGSPVNGARDITFNFYTNDSCSGVAVYITTENDVPVTDGLFSVDVDIGQNYFHGQGLWLEVEVDGTEIGCEEILPVPYALSLRPGATIAGIPTGWTGSVLSVDMSGAYPAASAIHGTTATGSAVRGESGGGSAVSGSTETGYGVYGYDGGTEQARGYGGYFFSQNGVGVYGQSNAATDHPNIYAPGVYGRSANGVGVYGETLDTNSWAGYFSSAGRGVYASVPSGNVGFNTSGSKLAVVAASDGARLLYTEESTEVWFTDYGFGTLEGGDKVVAMDPIFAETVNLNEPYHVFVEPYGPASLYVTDRTPTGFVVRAREGEPDVEFSYRIVAKRLEYEDHRLERAPWADNDPHLYPERTGEVQQTADGGER
ncbi:MAG: hypothetical protein R6X31_10225 [Anaerolineae bacterium]